LKAGLAIRVLNQGVLANLSPIFVGQYLRFYIAQEIDMPFGEDSNDLPVELLQHQFNENLLHLSSQLGPVIFFFQPVFGCCSPKAMEGQ